jgi:hypothetical protein
MPTHTPVSDADTLDERQDDHRERVAELIERRAARISDRAITHYLDVERDARFDAALGEGRR